jgi:tartrate dehydratase alpha subunit/fumarate hydratase class I-like protein
LADGDFGAFLAGLGGGEAALRAAVAAMPRGPSAAPATNACKQERREEALVKSSDIDMG